jgi:hypothetical protein
LRAPAIEYRTHHRVEQVRRAAERLVDVQPATDFRKVLDGQIELCERRESVIDLVAAGTRVSS